MSSKTVLRGICKNCVNGRTCTLMNGRRWRVTQCEEFIAITRIDKERPWVNPTNDDEMAAVMQNGRRGLCRSCGRWQECTFPHAEGGAWHCEEYC